RVLLAPARHHLDVFGHLADGRAHATLRHAMRAAEVPLDRVPLGPPDTPEDAFPALFGPWHPQGVDHRPVGPLLLDPLDLLQVDLERPVGDQLDIVEAVNLLAAIVDRAIARTDVHNRRVLAK